jgi:tRNA nucleotidyltransferase/poly(A) polymerase
MILKNRSKNNYLVGGCVRDYLLHVEPKDFDIVTDITYNVLEKDFANAGWKVSTNGKAFLVLNISKNGRQYEIANFRKDGVYKDGRRPESVEVGTIDEDAARRDFTINALYFDVNTFEMTDPTGKGQSDIQKKILRFIGRPEDRIKEDYLRIFRFYRFAAKGFKPDPKSLRAVREHFTEAYPKITAERVRAELEKMI